MSITKKTVEDFLDEIKATIKEYFHETTEALKERVKKLLITSVITIVLVAIVVSFIGSAVIFILVGSLKYLTMFVPVWEAWIIIGIISIGMGLIVLLMVFLIIRKQLKQEKQSNPIAGENQNKPKEASI